MQNYVVNLECEVGNSFRCQKAADSVNLDAEEKNTHRLSVQADLSAPYNVGLIIGPSGSGKTTLAKQIFGDLETVVVDLGKPIIDQFDPDMSYDEVVDCLTGMGLTSIPCWIRPFRTLSNGQQARALAALEMARKKNTITVIDEWTSVVDRAVAKVMSHKIQKECRKKQRKIVLLSCHYDVEEWLNPDWVIDCTTGEYKDRRTQVKDHKRSEELEFTVGECKKKTWDYFSKYHYLSHNLAPRTDYTFGLFHNGRQVGFCAFTNYSFHSRTHYHSNRVVVHPDFVGLGLGIKMVNEASEYLHKKGFRVSAKFTSIAMLKARLNDARWIFVKKQKVSSKQDGAIGLLANIDGLSRDNPEDVAKIMKKVKERNSSKLFWVTYYLFEYRGAKHVKNNR